MVGSQIIFLNFPQVVHQYSTADHVGLAGLESVDASVDIDGIRTKHGQHAHIQEIQIARFNHSTIRLRINYHEIIQQITK